MIVFDGFIISLMFLLAYFLRQHFHIFYKLNLIPSAQVVTPVTASINEYFLILCFIVPMWCGILYCNGMYHSMRTRTPHEIVWIIIKTTFLAAFCFGAIVFLFKMKFVSRIFFFIFMTTSSITILIEKITIFFIMHYIRKQGYNYKRLLVVGTGRRAVNFINKIKKHPEWGVRIEGILDYEKNLVGNEIKGIKVIGTLENLEDILHEIPIDEVIFIVPRSKLTKIEDSLYTCETEGVKTTIAVDLFELKIARSRQTELDGIPLITFETTFAHEWQLFIKRAIDIIVSALGLVFLMPLFLVVAILVKLTSRGPVLFLQKRVGLNGRKFTLYKFRTMHKGAHERLSQLERLNEMGGPVFKIKDDPRITPVGKILRKFSLDELPQLFNIFIGHMSLVGPRPPLPREVAQYKPWQRRRLSMRPGLTCLWQISGRNKIDFNEWMELDLEYLDKWSLWLDSKILMRTIPVVIFGIGAQ